LREDSRTVNRGDLFVAVRGHRVDGHDFIAAAEKRGAAAAIVERVLPFSGTLIRVPSSAEALGLMAANRQRNPGASLCVIGITGTNGKTTTSFLVESMLQAAGAKPGLIGTVAYRYGTQSEAAPLTTP